MTLRLVSSTIMPTAIEAQVDWLNDPEVVRYSEQRHKTHTIESQIKYLRSFIGSPHILKRIIDDDEDRYIGNITAHVDPHNSVADVGILIGHKPSWGKGYGTKAWMMFCNSLFEGGIRKIEAGCMSANKPMLHIFNKYQMTLEGRRLDHFQFEPERYVDMLLYARYHA